MLIPPHICPCSAPPPHCDCWDVNWTCDWPAAAWTHWGSVLETLGCSSPSLGEPPPSKDTLQCPGPQGWGHNQWCSVWKTLCLMDTCKDRWHWIALESIVSPHWWYGTPSHGWHLSSENDHQTPFHHEHKLSQPMLGSTILFVSCWNMAQLTISDVDITTPMAVASWQTLYWSKDHTDNFYTWSYVIPEGILSCCMTLNYPVT